MAEEVQGSANPQTIPDFLRELAEVIEGNDVAADDKVVTLTEMLPRLAEAAESYERMDADYGGLSDSHARDSARVGLWREIAVAMRECAVSASPVVWQSQRTELIRKLFRDDDAFEAEVTARMGGKYRDLLLEPTAPPSDDKSSA